MDQGFSHSSLTCPADWGKRGMTSMDARLFIHPDGPVWPPGQNVPKAEGKPRRVLRAVQPCALPLLHLSTLCPFV